MPEVTKLEEEKCWQLDLGEPPPDVLEWAKENLNETPESKLKCIQDLRDMIYERGECTPHRMDDAFLLRFLRARYFVVERAHRLIVNYYQFKEETPEFHKDVEPLALEFIGEAGVLSVPPYRDQTGRRLMMYRIGNWDTAAYSVDEIFKATVIILELGLMEQRAQILGGVALFDFENLSMQHAWQVTPTVASRVIQIMVSCLPMRIQALHIVNQSWAFDVIYSAFKPFLDERMKERLFFHGADMESLHKHVSPKFLPERYGGTRPDYSYTPWFQSLRQNMDIVEDMRALGYIIKPEDVLKKEEDNEKSQNEK